MKKLLFVLAITAPFLSIAQLTDSAQRLVPLQGAINFRDVGGYKTKDGKTVKWNRVFRSAAINRLTDADMRTIQSKHIYTVIDFRGTQEAAAAPDRLLPGTDYTLSPAGSDSLPDMKRMSALLQEGHFLDKMYGKASIQHFGTRYKPMFQKMLALNDTAAILYHCTGGRDRTGMATALFLYTLGVPQETIEADFTASNVYLRTMHANMFAPLAKATGMSEAAIKKEMELRPELIRIFFNAIKEQYGSIDKFLETELGIGKKEIAILRDKYTV